MAWKDDLATLVERTESLLRTVHLLQQLTVAQSKRLDKLQKVVETLARGGGQSAERMADRLIEMAMVNKGTAEMAAAHRRSLRDLDTPTDLWEDHEDEVWPPKGFDALQMP